MQGTAQILWQCIQGSPYLPPPRPPPSVLSVSLLLFPSSAGLEASSGSSLPLVPGFHPHHWAHTAASRLVLPPTWSTSAVWAASAVPRLPRFLRAPAVGVHRGRPVEGRPRAARQWRGRFQRVVDLMSSFTLRDFSFPFDPSQFMKNRTHVFLINFYKITEMLTF